MILDSYYVDEVREKLQEIGRELPENLILDAAINAQKAVSDYYYDTSVAVMEALEDLSIDEPIRFRELHPGDEEELSYNQVVADLAEKLYDSRMYNYYGFSDDKPQSIEGELTNCQRFLFLLHISRPGDPSPYPRSVEEWKNLFLEILPCLPDDEVKQVEENIRLGLRAASASTFLTKNHGK